MRVGELARRTGVTVRALRYYEAAGLVVPVRLGNGYREYDPIAVRLVAQIRSLTALGLTVEQTRPFVECLLDGHRNGDVCPAALATYRQAIAGLQHRIGELARQRDALHAHFTEASARTMAAERCRRHRTRAGTPNPTAPADLRGRPAPALVFASTDGSRIGLNELGAGRSIVFVYPLTGRPGVDLPDGWEQIPGAQGCTAQACGFRDQHAELIAAGAARVYGLSAQSTRYQAELAHRLRLPYPLLADPRLTLADSFGLATFEAGGMTLYRRLTLVITDGLVEHVFHPISRPTSHAVEILSWLANCSTTTKHSGEENN